MPTYLPTSPASFSLPSRVPRQAGKISGRHDTLGSALLLAAAAQPTPERSALRRHRLSLGRLPVSAMRGQWRSGAGRKRVEAIDQLEHAADVVDGSRCRPSFPAEAGAIGFASPGMHVASRMQTSALLHLSLSLTTWSLVALWRW
ncbi:hypothetical protein CDD83_7613 [Cordyceps sp. RAO-2017]|nr:hypothetical protein CDD83_7613 [Cordyceps sp. RAO-2017]